ncbi:copper-binding protein NosD [Cellulophaga sp. RHA19]|uniref:NosD domain-containing protein n=1 Tax=Cellulophaga sp. RHA19 TaxID=1798237 RepID=UPI000C2B65EB|nr:NosD domain-containing protein [Cellulophaga sp. RHA19]PKB44660.1 copper-binding protein NosD [Cellulophaga sp. RHA19]
MYKQPLTLVKVLVYSLVIATTTVSCSQEDLLANVIEENAAEEEPDTEPDVQPVDDLKINTTPCDYTLDGIAAGTTLAIECQLDLDGKTVSLPTGVTLEYKGGEIINGTLNFTAGGKIDGNLLNQNLTVEGNVSLLSETFEFHPSRWDIVQGITTSQIAQKNNNNLEDLMFYTKSIGATTFTIDKFDAYFEVSKVTSTTTNQNFYPQKEAVNIPGDFTLLMTDNTILRVFPTVGKVAATLLALDNVSNTIVKGGTLYGDRDLRNYSKKNAEEGSHLFLVKSSNNIVLDNITFTMGSLGGLNINSYGFTFNSDYIPTNDVIIKDCTFEKVRMMSLALTDGYDISIDNNTFIDSSQPTSKSDGGVVGYAINMEPVRKRDAATGDLVLYQKVHDVVIKNNKETGSREGAITIFSGDNIIIENNELENVVSYTFATNSKIRNNNFTATSDPRKPAIIAGGKGETVYDNEISGNVIFGYEVGISANHKLVDIFENKIENCRTGIQLKESTDMKIYKNVITSNISTSRGIMAHIANVNNVDIYNNDISVPSNPLYFVQLNKKDYASEYTINVYDNNFNTKGAVTITSSKGIKLERNSFFGGIQSVNADNLTISNNIINTSNSHGIALNKENYDVTLNNNKITYLNINNYECIKIASTTSKSEIVMSNNTCN